MQKLGLLILMIPVLTLYCSSGSKFLPINDYHVQQAAQSDYLQWKTGSMFWHCAGGRYSTAEGFLRGFGSYSDLAPFPLVTWALDWPRSGKAEFMISADEPCFEYPEHKPWAEAIQRISTWAGPYSTIAHPGFIEIVWGEQQTAQRRRSQMLTTVPPIVFRSYRAADFLAMWHAVSGMEFKYDPELVNASLTWDKDRIAEESDPALPTIENSREPFPLGLVSFRSPQSLLVGDFMSKLAAHIGGLARETRDGWVIERFQRDQEGLQLIEHCLTQIRQDHSISCAAEPIEILSRIGVPALPEILRELDPPNVDSNVDRLSRQIAEGRIPKSIDSTLEHCLVQAISRTRSPLRDQVLLRRLVRYAHGGPAFVRDSIIQALAWSNYRLAEPLIREIAHNSETRESRIVAKVALNRLGFPEKDSQKELHPIDIGVSATKSLEQQEGKQALVLLRAVLTQCDQYRAGMEIRSAEVFPSKTIVLWGYSSRPVNKYNHWTFEVPVIRKDRVLARFSYVCGRLCGNGYLATLEMKDGRWLVTNWAHLWTS